MTTKNAAASGKSKSKPDSETQAGNFDKKSDNFNREYTAMDDDKKRDMTDKDGEAPYARSRKTGFEPKTDDGIGADNEFNDGSKKSRAFKPMDVEEQQKVAAEGGQSSLGGGRETGTQGADGKRKGKA